MDEKLQELLKYVKGRSARKRYGMGLKSSYLADLNHCFQGGHCPSKLFANAPSGDALAQLFKDAEHALTYCDKNMLIEDAKGSDGASEDGSIMSFDFIATSKKKDRDGDVLDPAGAMIDDKMPLLWQHIPFEPIGRMVKVLDRNSRKIRMRANVLGTDLGKDAALLIRGGALRISHGFIPLEYEPMYKNDKFDGWLIKEYEMMEVSVVSIPSNTDAIITAYSDSKLHHPAVKGWAKRFYDERPTVVPVGIDLKSLPAGTTITLGGEQKQACGCKAKESQEPEAEPTDDKSVVPYAATEKAPKDHPWDAAGARKRLEDWSGMSDDKTDSAAQAKYKRAFAIVDGDASNLGSYKLPHHDIVNGKLAVVWSGVHAAMSVIDGGRGGLNASDSDKSGAKAHLAKHYAQFGETPPGEGDGKSAEAEGQPEEAASESSTEAAPEQASDKSLDELMQDVLRKFVTENHIPLKRCEAFIKQFSALVEAGKQAELNEHVSAYQYN